MTAKVYQISDHKRFKKKINLHYDFKTSFTRPPDYPVYDKYKTDESYKTESWDLNRFIDKAIKSQGDQQAGPDMFLMRPPESTNLDPLSSHESDALK